MLVLTRKLGESIAIDNNIKITVVQVKGKQVRIGIDAPENTKIHRQELYTSAQQHNRTSEKTSSQSVRPISKLLKTN